jgi:hypothetical protein
MTKKKSTATRAAASTVEHRAIKLFKACQENSLFELWALFGGLVKFYTGLIPVNIFHPGEIDKLLEREYSNKRCQ